MQKGRTHNGQRSRTIIDRRSNTWPERIAATDSDWLTAYLYYGIIRATLYPDGGRTPGFWAPRRVERDREPPPSSSSFWAAPSSAESHEPTKGRDAHAVDLHRLIWCFWTIVHGFCSRETRFYAARRDRKSGSALSGTRLSGTPKKGAHRQNAERRKRERIFPPRSAKSQRAGVVSSSISSWLWRSVDPPLTKLFDTPFSLAEKTLYKSYGNSRAPGIYIQFVEIVMNLQPTILPQGPAQKAPKGRWIPRVYIIFCSGLRCGGVASAVYELV